MSFPLNIPNPGNVTYLLATSVEYCLCGTCSHTQIFAVAFLYMANSCKMKGFLFPGSAICKYTPLMQN